MSQPKVIDDSACSTSSHSLRRARPWMALPRAGSVTSSSCSCPSNVHRAPAVRLGHGTRIWPAPFGGFSSSAKVSTNGLPPMVSERNPAPISVTTARAFPRTSSNCSPVGLAMPVTVVAYGDRHDSAGRRCGRLRCPRRTRSDGGDAAGGVATAFGDLPWAARALLVGGGGLAGPAHGEVVDAPQDQADDEQDRRDDVVA